MSLASNRTAHRLAVLLGTMIGVALLFVGILLMNESVYAKTIVHINLFGPSVEEEPDRYSYPPGLLMTVSGAGLLGFAIGRGTRPPNVEEIQFPNP